MDFFGEYEILHGIPREHFASADKDTVLLCLNKAEFFSVFQPEEIRLFELNLAEKNEFKSKEYLIKKKNEEILCLNKHERLNNIIKLLYSNSSLKKAKIVFFYKKT